MGPQNKWVEVQIRTKRMDEIAERGLAAHWKYKGVKAESGLDEFLNTVRAALEAKENNPLDLMQDFKMDLRLHAYRRAYQAGQGSDGPRFRLCHPHEAGKQMRIG